VLGLEPRRRAGAPGAIDIIARSGRFSSVG
jgi:hypothetical protein